MKKCKLCNSCLSRVYVENSIYYYCDFCNNIQTLTGDILFSGGLDEYTKSFSQGQKNPEAKEWNESNQ